MKIIFLLIMIKTLEYYVKNKRYQVISNPVLSKNITEKNFTFTTNNYRIFI